MSNYNPYTKRQTMIAPDYEVYRYRSTYMNEVELHHHDFYEIYLLLRGRVEYIVENQLYRVRPGDWMLCSPLELHQARIDTDADAYERAGIEPSEWTKNASYAEMREYALMERLRERGLDG